MRGIDKTVALKTLYRPLRRNADKDGKSYHATELNGLELEQADIWTILDRLEIKKITGPDAILRAAYSATGKHRHRAQEGRETAVQGEPSDSGANYETHDMAAPEDSCAGILPSLPAPNRPSSLR
jgi:hypothetical protein